MKRKRIEFQLWRSLTLLVMLLVLSLNTGFARTVNGSLPHGTPTSVAVNNLANGVIFPTGKIPLSGVAYNVSDVFAGVGNGKIKHFSPNGVLLDTLDTTMGSSEDTGMAFDLVGNLYTTNFTANSMSKFNNSGGLIGPFGGGFNNHPESVLVNAAGDFYVGQADGSHQVLKFNASGGLLGSFSPAIEARGTDWIDLAADQCTLLYTSEGKLIKRFNVCTNTQLSDFATLPIDGVNPESNPSGSVAYALRIRPNQEVMVAASQQVFRLNPSGAVIQTYPKPAGETSFLFALNLDADLTSFWTAGLHSGNVYKIDIATGAVLKSFNAGILGPSLAGLTVFGEIVASQPKLILTPTTDTKTVGTSETLTAELLNVVNPAGTIVAFTVTGANAQTGTGTADATGRATFTYTGNNAGTDTVVATAATIVPPANLTSNSSTIIWNQAATKLTYNGATTSDFHDPAIVSAILTRGDTNAPIPGATISFSLDADATCTGTTDAAGVASCDITPNIAAGTYPLTASFAGNTNFLASDTQVQFIVTLEETTLTYTGPTLIANGQPAILSGVLKEDGTVPIAGRTVAFTLGTGASAQSCTGTTDAAGVANCTISAVAQPLGSGTAKASFAGDAFYLPSSDSKATIIFAFLARGSFVVGNRSATGAVTFWSDQWAKANALSGGGAPNSFKGFADTLSSSLPRCGGSWSTHPGNSPPPPNAPLPTFMAVLVASSVDQSGNTISGDISAIVIVKTDPGYKPNPGHHGTGTVVAVLCQENSRYLPFILN
jgi:Bacterial Ig-like domain (group 3)